MSIRQFFLTHQQVTENLRKKAYSGVPLWSPLFLIPAILLLLLVGA